MVTLVQGGYNGSDYLKSVEVLDLSSGDGWVLWKPLPFKLLSQAMTTVFGPIFTFGGIYIKEPKAENNGTLMEVYSMEVFLLNKKEEVFESYGMNINKHPTNREYGHTVVRVYIDEICDL